MINLGRAAGVVVLMSTARDLNAALLPWILFAVMLAQFMIPAVIRGTNGMKKVN